MRTCRSCESCLRNLCVLATLREVLVLIIAARSVFFVSWFRCGSKSSTTEDTEHVANSYCKERSKLFLRPVFPYSVYSASSVVQSPTTDEGGSLKSCCNQLSVPLREVLVLIIAARSVFFVSLRLCGSKSSTTEEKRNTEEPGHQGNDMITKDPKTKGLLVGLNHKGTKEQSEGSNAERVARGIEPQRHEGTK